MTGWGQPLNRRWSLAAFHPHLTSPLEGGRDELGKDWGWGWVGSCRAGSCLRRNDEGGAGMTEGAQE